MLQRLYTWSMDKAAHPWAGFYLWFVSFVESFVSPFPPDPFMVPMIIAKPHKAWWYAFLCTMGSVVGGIIGYYIGYVFFDTLGEKILDLYGLHNAFEKLKYFFETYGFWIIFFKGFTPIPFKIVAITCGVTKINMVVFLLASILSRGMRFYIEAYVFWRWGAAMQGVFEKNMRLVVILFTLLLVFGYYMIKHIV